MKLGFYVDTNGGTPQNTEIYNFLNEVVTSGTVEDAAVFFNSIDFNPVHLKFGIFDAAELWHFTGNLVVTSTTNVVKVRNIVNKFKVAYLFTIPDTGEHTFFELIRISKEMPVIVLNELDAVEFYRLTGVQPTVMNGLSVDKLEEVFNG